LPCFCLFPKNSQLIFIKTHALCSIWVNEWIIVVFIETACSICIAMNSTLAVHNTSHSSYEYQSRIHAILLAYVASKYVKAVSCYYIYFFISLDLRFFFKQLMLSFAELHIELDALQIWSHLFLNN
jgi:hypothetical protein